MKKLNIADLADEDRFEVELSRPIQIGRRWARPGQRVELKGRLVKEHEADVADVRPLAD